MKNKIKGYVNSVETFGLVDGPGVRFVIFMQGCKMRCRYCHNPETWKLETGEGWTPEELFEKAYRYKAYWKNNGGITVSGGEPLLQLDFIIELFKIAKENKVHTSLDTSGGPFTLEEPFFSKFKELMKYTDLVILDLKQMDNKKHKDLTGVGNKNILKMAKYLSDINKDMWIRRVLVPNLTDDEKELKVLQKFITSLKNVSKIEVLPYHALGIPKWNELGIKYTLNDAKAPTKEEKEKAEKILGVK